jgi:hypothetical protein
MNEIANTLHTLLAHNIVYFTFRKVNGEIRHAVGTRNILAAENYTSQYISRPMGEEQPNSYYDVEKMGWRSYKPENLISIDKVIPRTEKPTPLNKPPKEAKKPELPKREIPVSKPMGNGGVDIDKFLGGIFGGLGLARPPKEEIRKSMDDLGKDIVIGAPAHSPKIGTPTATEKGVALPLNGVSVEDFAKMVAHYVVEEIVSRIKG